MQPRDVTFVDPIRAQLARQGLVFENRGQSRTAKGTLQTTYSVRPRRDKDRIVGHLGSMPIVVSPVRPSARRTPPCSSPAPARRSPRRRSNATRDGPARLSDDDPEPPRLCRCGCGETLPPRRRGYVDDDHSNRARQRRFKAHVRTERRLAPESIEVCPSCGGWCNRLDDFTGWCKSCTREAIGAAA